MGSIESTSANARVRISALRSSPLSGGEPTVDFARYTEQTLRTRSSGDAMTRHTLIQHAAMIAIFISFVGVASGSDAIVPASPFAVTLPAGYGEFTRQVQTVPSPEGEIETTSWISKAPTGEAVIVTMSTMP